MKRRIARALLGVLFVGSLSACTPQEWIILHFGAEAPAAIRVAQCESSMNPNAVSPGGGNHGLFQINNVHRATFERVTGRPWSDRYDAGANAQFAHWLWEQQGWGPWSCKP